MGDTPRLFGTQGGATTGTAALGRAIYKSGAERMIPQTCVVIETKKFPALEGEDDELANERMYGKALCNYLKAELPAVGIGVPSFCNEDWGWWLEVERNGFKMGLCIYSDPGAVADPERYALMPSVREASRWSWSKFRTVDVSRDVLEIINAVVKVFENDEEILAVTRHDDYPF